MYWYFTSKRLAVVFFLLFINCSNEKQDEVNSLCWLSINPPSDDMKVLIWKDVGENNKKEFVRVVECRMTESCERNECDCFTISVKKDKYIFEYYDSQGKFNKSIKSDLSNKKYWSL